MSSEVTEVPEVEVSKEPTLEELQQQRAEATTPDIKAALTKKIRAAGGEVASSTRQLTAEMLNAARQEGDSKEDVLERLGFEVNAARKARITYLENREVIAPFIEAE